MSDDDIEFSSSDPVSDVDEDEMARLMEVSDITNHEWFYFRIYKYLKFYVALFSKNVIKFNAVV